MRVSPRPLTIEWFDQFEKCAIRIFEAEKFGSGFIAEADDNRFGNTFNSICLKPLVFGIQIFREQRNPGNASVVEMGIRGTLGGWLFPLNQIKARRAWIITE